MPAQSCIIQTFCCAGEERFSSKPREGRLEEIESLREFLIANVKVIDERTAQIAAPAQRLKTLLMSKDKKATILDMAGKMPLFAYLYTFSQLVLLGTSLCAWSRATVMGVVMIIHSTT